MRKLIIALALLLVPSAVHATTITVKTSGGTYTLSQLQTAINASACGDTITIEAGATITGTFNLPLRSCTGNPILITTDASAGNLPATSAARTGPQYAQYMPKLKSAGGGASVITTSNNTAGWTLRHLEIGPVPGGYNTIIAIGDAAGGFTSIEPHDIIIEQNYIHGDVLFGQKTGINLSGHTITVRYNYMDRITGMGQDAECIAGLNGSGDWTINDNYLECSTYSIIFGGGDPKNRTYMSVTGNGTTTGADVTTTESGHTCAELSTGGKIAVETAAGVRYTALSSITGSGATCTLVWTAIDTAPSTGNLVRRSNVPKTIQVNRNTMTKQLAWQNGIIPKPSTPSVSTGAGTLATGTYYYFVQSSNTGGYQGGIIYSDPTTEVSGTLASAGSVTLTFGTLSTATGFRVWRCTATASTTTCGRTDVNSLATSFTDDGTKTYTASTRPTKGSRWIVKNNFEMKTGDTVYIGGNIMEYNWIGDGGEGMSVWLKDNNQDGGGWANYTYNVTFENNIIRSTPAFLVLSSMETNGGYRPRKMDTIIVRNNLVYDCGSQYDPNNIGSRIMQQAGPIDNLTLQHNSVFCEAGSGHFIYFTDSNNNLGFSTNENISYNIGFKNRYGVWGALGEGTATLDYFLGAGAYTFSQNDVAGASCGSYPATTVCTAVATFKGYFTNYSNTRTGGVFTLTGSTPLDNAAPGPSDLGADIAAVNSAVAGTGGGNAPPAITLLTMPDGERGITYPSQTVTFSGGTGSITWSTSSGTLPTGLTRSTNVISGTPTTNGTYTFTIRATDTLSAIDDQTYIVNIVDPVTVSTTSPLPPGPLNVAYNVQLAVTGGVTPVTWALTSGTLPTGLSLSTSGVISGTPTVAASTTFSVTATGAGGSTNTKSLTLVTSASDIPPGRPVFTGPMRQEIQNFRRTVAPTCADNVARGDRWTDISGGTNVVSKLAQNSCPAALQWKTDGDLQSLDAGNLVAGFIPNARYSPDVSFTNSMTTQAVNATTLNFTASSCVTPADPKEFAFCLDVADGTLKSSYDGAAYAPFQGSVTPTTRATTLQLFNSPSGTGLGGITWTNQPAGLTEFLGGGLNRVAIDMTGYTQYKLYVRVVTAGATGATCAAYWNGINGGGFGPLDVAATGVAINTTGHKISSAWLPIDPNARQESWISLYCVNGDGVADPAFGNVNVVMK